MSLITLLLINLAGISLAVGLLWMVSLMLRNASIIDMFWGLGFVAVACVSGWLGEQSSPRSILLIWMVTIWGIRLSGYLVWRNAGHGEDYRYAAMRERHGRRFPWVSLFTVFGLQGLLVWFIGLPVQVGIHHAGTWHSWRMLGVAVWMTGLFFEAVGDFQLARFKANRANQGRVMDRGLWRYTRHPNYFGDFLVWWGIFLVAAELHSWWWTIAGPLLMSFLLLRVSGVRLLESSLQNRVDGYDRYVRVTSPFFPWPPRNEPRSA